MSTAALAAILVSFERAVFRLQIPATVASVRSLVAEKTTIKKRVKTHATIGCLVHVTVSQSMIG